MRKLSFSHHPLYIVTGPILCLPPLSLSVSENIMCPFYLISHLPYIYALYSPPKGISWLKISLITPFSVNLMLLGMSSQHIHYYSNISTAHFNQSLTLCISLLSLSVSSLSFRLTCSCVKKKKSHTGISTAYNYVTLNNLNEIKSVLCFLAQSRCQSLLSHPPFTWFSIDFLSCIHSPLP